MSLKIYMANAVWLRNVPKKHASSNGARQFTILVRAKNQKEVAALVENSLGHLRKYGGMSVAPEKFGYDEEHVPAEIVKKDHTVYYQPGATCSGWHLEWFEYPSEMKD
jgi:hypothetical protein